MACVPLTCLMNTIQFEFLQPRPPVILDEDTTRVINSLYENLGFLLDCPQELVKKPGIDAAAVKDLEAEIRDFAFSAEDEIESNLTNIYMEAADQEMILFQNLQQVAEDAEMILFQNLRQLAEDTHEFVNRIKSQYYDSAAQDLPKVHTLSSDLESISLGESSRRFSKIEGRMVGHSSELNTIRDQLTRHPSGDGKVISIVGMSGIGKTTLAKRVFEDPLVISHFDVRAWATVSQDANLRHILGELLRFTGMFPEMNTDRSTDELAHKLQRGLMGRRYLIVMDDVWDTNVWDYLTRCFPKSDDGSGVLLTTQLEEIANYTTGTNLHKLHFLDSKDSWDLFCNNIFLKEPFPSKFEIIGRNIVDKCGGLPLAIVVAAGLVSQLNKDDELENIEEEISCIVSKDLGEQCSRILTLSYNHLPQHLKACFLYLGVFSANSEIPVKKLVRLWMAEGFVNSVRDKKLEEVGAGYLEDLIRRSLVQIDKLKCDGEIKTCRMHDLLHGLCVRQATNENLLYAEDNIDFDMCNSSKKGRDDAACRWLSFRSSKPENFDIIRNNYKRARSVLCLHNDEMPMVNPPKPVRFNLLRVLDLTSSLYTKGVYVSFPDLSDLVLLNYLVWSLGSEGFEIILSKNQKLQTLVVLHSAAGWEVDGSLLPSTIWGSPQLRHLEFKNSFRVERPSMVNENLQTLYWLSIFDCTEAVFSKIPIINTLGISCNHRLNPDQGESYTLENLPLLNQLMVLTIEFINWLPPPRIDAFPSNLRKLKLSRTRLPWKDIKTIALLPHLQVLRLKMDAFVGPEWKPTEGGFRQLKYLLLQNDDLKIWNASDDEFLKLERLVLRHCVRLEEIPSAFSDINSLQSIELEICRPALLASAKKIKEEKLSYGDDGLIVTDRTPQYTSEKSVIDLKRISLGLYDDWKGRASTTHFWKGRASTTHLRQRQKKKEEKSVMSQVEVKSSEENANQKVKGNKFLKALCMFCWQEDT